MSLFRFKARRSRVVHITESTRWRSAPVPKAGMLCGREFLMPQRGQVLIGEGRKQLTMTPNAEPVSCPGCIAEAKCRARELEALLEGRL